MQSTGVLFLVAHGLSKATGLPPLPWPIRVVLVASRPKPMSGGEKFWKPGTVAPGLEREPSLEEDVSVLLSTVKATEMTASVGTTIDQFRRQLPVYKHRREFLYALTQSPVVIVCGQTGSGKTTQLPQYVYEAGYQGMVACTQPRRVAAMTVAKRVAEEVDCSLGDLVGFGVRFEECSGPTTRIKYLTDGMLFREALFDPLLLRYSVIMIDEAHERTLYTDLLLGLLRKILRKRRDLRVVISSATMDAEAFCAYFTDAPGSRPVVMSVQGRMNPVEIFYYESDDDVDVDVDADSDADAGDHNHKDGCDDQYQHHGGGDGKRSGRTPVASHTGNGGHDNDGEYLLARLVNRVVSTVISVHEREPPGDILVFLPGKGEIDQCLVQLEEAVGGAGGDLLILPLHAALPLPDQMRALERAPRGRRKVILSTNIAETSVTIDGIIYVVDGGLVRQRLFNPETGLDILLTTPISQAEAQQRAGRAGRMAPGRAYRLYGETMLARWPRQTLPEIQKCDLSTVILQLKALGIDNIVAFDWMSRPSADCLARSLEMLHALGALDGEARLTREIGVPLAELPVDPLLGRILLASGEYSCGGEAATLAAMLTAQPIWMASAGEEARARLAVVEGDLISWINIYRAWEQAGRSDAWCRRHHLSATALGRAAGIRTLLCQYMERHGLRPREHSQSVPNLLRCIATGLFAHAALAQADGSYRLVRDVSGGEGPVLYIHPSSVLFRRVPSCLLYWEVMETSRIYMREVTAINPEWLAEVAPNYYEVASLPRH